MRNEDFGVFRGFWQAARRFRSNSTFATARYPKGATSYNVIGEIAGT
jgi:hypothetical protein